MVWEETCTYPPKHLQKTASLLFCILVALGRFMIIESKFKYGKRFYGQHNLKREGPELREEPLIISIFHFIDD